MARGAGLWLDADVLLLKPVEIDPAKPYFAWEGPRQLGNSVLYLPPNDPIAAAFAALMQQDELVPDWLALRHRLTFALRKLRGGSRRLSDIRIAIFGPPALTALARRAGELHYALPKKSFYAVHADPNASSSLRIFPRCSTTPKSSGFMSPRRAALASRPFPAASTPGRQSGSALESSFRGDAKHRTRNRPGPLQKDSGSALFDLAQRSFPPLAHDRHYRRCPMTTQSTLFATFHDWLQASAGTERDAPAQHASSSTASQTICGFRPAT